MIDSPSPLRLYPVPPLSSHATADVTYFVLPGHTDKGIGRAVLDYLLAAGRKLGVRNVLASVSSLNRHSLAFHRKAWFVEAGSLRDVGVKNGENFDEVWLQLRI